MLNEIDDVFGQLAAEDRFYLLVARLSESSLYEQPRLGESGYKITVVFLVRIELLLDEFQSSKFGTSTAVFSILSVWSAPASVVACGP